jgi:hypothetical protein
MSATERRSDEPEPIGEPVPRNIVDGLDPPPTRGVSSIGTVMEHFP